MHPHSFDTSVDPRRDLLAPSLPCSLLGLRSTEAHIKPALPSLLHSARNCYMSHANMSRACNFAKVPHIGLDNALLQLFGQGLPHLLDVRDDDFLSVDCGQPSKITCCGSRSCVLPPVFTPMVCASISTLAIPFTNPPYLASRYAPFFLVFLSFCLDVPLSSPFTMLASCQHADHGPHVVALPVGQHLHVGKKTPTLASAGTCAPAGTCGGAEMVDNDLVLGLLADSLLGDVQDAADLACWMCAIGCVVEELR